MVELPLLFEKNLQHHFTHTISMFAPESTVLNRLALRGLSPEGSRARIEAQLPSPTKAALADFVLWGDGSPQYLLAQIRELSI